VLTADELKTLITETDSKTFCRDHLFSSDCWAFEDDSSVSWRGSYAQFRRTIAKILDINPNNVSIVGSAKFGLSLSPVPAKTLLPFRAVSDGNESDVDIAIVSPTLFEKTWTSLRLAYYNGYTDVRKLHGRELFFKFVSLKSTDEYATEYLSNLQKLVESMKAELNKIHRISNPIKYRIYESYEEVENYHIFGMNEVKKAL
jgi:hypothetical protein